MFKNHLLNGASVAAMSVAVTATMTADAQAQSAIDEIVVTARKKAESLQDVPVAVSALGEKQLDQLGVDVFTDYLVQMPGITAGGSGPGQNTIYIRGVASTTPNLTTAGVAGLAPNVALYLDEQPLSQPGRNLDVYAVDMERVEVLAGPQGTLFGASSQAGVVRLITNKPKIGEYTNQGRVETAFTPEGDPSAKFEFVTNIPVNDKLAVRAVVYGDHQGGYIDNVLSTDELSMENSARFRFGDDATGTMRSNGVRVSSKRNGFQGGRDVSGVNFTFADNSDIAGDNINETTYSGLRTSVKFEGDNGVDVLASITTQKLESDGVFFDDPNKGDYEISRFQEDTMTDEFTNVNWTVEGELGGLQAIYTGALTERETDQVVDYTDYVFVGQYLPHYVCDTTVTYPAEAATLTGDALSSYDSSGAPTGDCSTPENKVVSFTELTNQSHEFRFSGDLSDRISATFGFFMSELELKERNNFVYLGSSGRFADVYPVNTTGISKFEVYDDTTIWRNDITRTDDQTGLFGEFTYDLAPDLWALTVGARAYDVSVDLKGSARGSFSFKDNNGDGTTPAPLLDTSGASNNLTTKFSASGPGPDKAEADGTIVKLSLAYTPSADKLYYATYSEGFRPGILNRPGGSSPSDSDYVVPYAVDTDEIKNYEFGWKITSEDRRLRFNGSAFFVDISNLQTTIFDPDIANLFFSENAADAEVMGVEGDVTYLPASMENLTLTGAFSFLDTEVTKVLVPTNDVDEGAPLAYAPEMQFNIRARYEWDYGDGLVAHIMPSVVYSDKQFSDIIKINRDEIDSYALVNLSVGVTADSWTGELYIDNVMDQHAELSRNYVNDVERVTPARPMTIGLRFARDF